jgi:methylmalonyl-CoA mutase cobalamin-binding subunit
MEMLPMGGVIAPARIRKATSMGADIFLGPTNPLCACDSEEPFLILASAR